MTLFPSLVLQWDEPVGPDRWLIRRSRRARRLSARVHLDGRVEIVVPERVSRGHVVDFIARHREWILQRQGEVIPRLEEIFPPPRLELASLSETWHVHLSGGAGTVRVRTPSHQLLALSGQGDRQTYARALRSWLTDHVRQPFEARLHALASEHGFEFRALQLRRQRTRWGSCSTRGVISINVCAAFQRPDVLDYLLLHELAHTREMNHSRRYWRLVADCCPQWRRLDRELAKGWQRVPRWIFED